MKNKNPLAQTAITLPSWIKIQADGFHISAAAGGVDDFNQAMGQVLEALGISAAGRRVYFAISERYTGADVVGLTDRGQLPKTVFYDGIKDLAARGLVEAKEPGAYWLNPGFVWQKSGLVKLVAVFQTTEASAGDALETVGLKAQAMRLMSKIFQPKKG